MSFIWLAVTCYRWIIRTYFDFKYSMNADPYRIKDSRYEQIKIAKGIKKIRGQKFSNVLEIGCGAGHHTGFLLQLSDRVLCIDNSSVALKRAREKISDERAIFKQLDIATDNLDEKFDLIFCSEVLYYLNSDQLHTAHAKIINWLKTGGILVLIHALLENNPVEKLFLKRPDARVIHSLFMDSSNLQTTHDAIEEFYRITVLKKLYE